ncbi:MAG: serine hydrolase domain-containing protein [Bacteroidales bacterium]
MNKTVRSFFLFLLVFFGAGQMLSANNVNSRPDSLPDPSLQDTIALEAFMDGVIHTMMDEMKIAGASISLIQNGELLLNKGYGYANIETDSKVDPDRTLFRLGSISKLFTWIAVLQQVEKGTLSLDADINQYLTSFSIPDTYKEPVTLRSLMSHTPGFEDILLHLFLQEGDAVPPLEEQFSEKLPRRIRPPLREAAYSNHGAGLAQLLVEKASGMPFEEYAASHIFSPLGMNSTTFRQPVPNHLQPHLSKGYAWQEGQFEPKGFEVVPMAGAGGASSTAADMAIFMDALLNETRHDTISLLDSATYAIMQEPVLQHADSMNPALHGFIDNSRRHLRMIGHGGNTFLFHSVLALFPEHNTALFMSFNGENAQSSYDNVLNHFLDRYFPPPQDLPATIELSPEYLEGFQGQYMSNRRPHSSLLKIIGSMNNLEVSAAENGIQLRDMFGETHQLAPVDSTTFFINQRNTYVGFSRQDGEPAEKLYLGEYPIMAFDRVTGVYQLDYHLIILAITLFCVLYILIVWPWLYFARRQYDKKPRALHNLPIFPKVIAWITSLFFLLFYLLLFSSAGGEEIIFGIPSGIRIALFFPIAAIPFTLLMIGSNIYIWKVPRTKNISRLFYGLATLAFLLSLWQLHFWNLIGWKF